MYIVECSYINNDFANPWKVSLIESRFNSSVETFKLKDETLVYELIDAYVNQYGKDNIILSEKVYSICPKLDFIKFRLGGTNE